MGITHKGSLLIVLLLFVTVKRLRKKTFHELSAMTFTFVCLFEWTPSWRKESGYPFIRDFASCLGLALIMIVTHLLGQS